MQYCVAYKCLLCGKEILYGDPKEIQPDKLPKLCADVIKNQQFLGNPYLYVAPMYIPICAKMEVAEWHILAGLHLSKNN